MNRFFSLFSALVKKHFIYMKRYAFNSISGIASLYILFLVIFYGAKGIGGGEAGFGRTLDGIVVGFLVWTFSLFAYSQLSWSLMQEAQQGTLEQLYMSPLGFRRVLLVQILTAFLFELATFAFLLALMMASTGRWLHLDVLSLIPLFVLTIAGVYGVGFVIGGLALVFKQIQSFFGLVQFLFLILIAAPLETFPAMKYLPLSWGTRLIGRVMVEGESLGSISTADLTLLALNAGFYFLAGFLFFRWMENIARDRGLLGHY